MSPLGDHSRRRRLVGEALNRIEGAEKLFGPCSRRCPRAESHIVLSDPPLEVLLRAHFADPPTGEQRPAWIAALLSAWGSRDGTERALAVTLDARNICELP
jgi:hypothetical protein